MIDMQINSSYSGRTLICRCNRRRFRKRGGRMWYLTLHRWVGDRQEAVTNAFQDHLA